MFDFSNGKMYFSGLRYPLREDLPVTPMADYIKTHFGVDISTIKKVPQMPKTFPEPTLQAKFMSGIQELKIDCSLEGEDRLIRCHGQTLHDIVYLQEGRFKRIPDLVLWPTSHDEVVEIVKLANDSNVAIIPFGGGTSVSGAVNCPQDEQRMIVVLDTSQMNRMLWLDKENLVACFEAGIVGQDLERVLANEDLMLGHEPDSSEFSTLGGWVATRASGMKKNNYGNIEELVIRVKLVTTKGVLERDISAPRVSCGPDFNHIIMGSEGTFGVITEVVIKVRPLPAVKKYGSLVFPDFESGVKCLREIAKRRCQPASIRLLDHDQYVLGAIVKNDPGFTARVIDRIKFFALKLKGFDVNQITVATLLFEGDAEDVEAKEKLVYAIAKKHYGLSVGETNGKKGYVSMD